MPVRWFARAPTSLNQNSRYGRVPQASIATDANECADHRASVLARTHAADRGETNQSPVRCLHRLSHRSQRARRHSHSASVLTRKHAETHTHKGEHRRECRCTGVAGRSIDLNCAARYLEVDGAKLWDLNYRLHGNVAPKPQQPKHTRVPSVTQACATNSGDRESAGQAVEWLRRHLPNQPSFVELVFDCR